MTEQTKELKKSPLLPRHSVKVGNVTVGGGAPVVVQSMTNTDTSDIEKSAEQVIELARAGSEIVRLTVNNDSAAKAIPYIREKVERAGLDVPLVGCFHYNGHLLLTKYPECAKSLAKYRINPGNVGFGEKHDRQFAMMIETAIKHDKPVRIGVNWGSLDEALSVKLMDENAKLPIPKSTNEVLREALIQSAITSAEHAEKTGLAPDKIIISCKTSVVSDLLYVYRELAARTSYALHLGLTEAGGGVKGIVSSTSGLAILLNEGIGDTIRVSLTPTPGEPRSKEVVVAGEILQSLGLRSFAPSVTSCPGCGRTTSTVFLELADTIQTRLRNSMVSWRDTRKGSENLKVAVMGCIVNGPGESKHADIGISLPGTGESPAAPVFIDGKKFTTLRGDNIANDFMQIVDDYVEKRWSVLP